MESSCSTPNFYDLFNKVSRTKPRQAMLLAQRSARAQNALGFRTIDFQLRLSVSSWDFPQKGRSRCAPAVFSVNLAVKF